MAGAGIHKQEAKRYVRVAQVAGIGLGLIATALWAVRIPGLNVPFQLGVPAPVQTSSQPTPVVKQAVFDHDTASGIADRLDEAANHAAAAPTGETGATGATGPTPPPAPPPPAWRYLGPIYMGESTYALVSIRGNDGARQRVLKLKQEVEGTKLVSIASDKIEIEDASGRHEIQRATREGASVAWLKNVAHPVAGPGAGPPGGRAGAPVGGTAQAPGGGDAQSRSLERLRRNRARAVGAGEAAGAGGTGTEDSAGTIVVAPQEGLGTSMGAAPDGNDLALQKFPDLMEYNTKLTELLKNGDISMEEFINDMQTEYKRHGLPYVPDKQTLAGMAKEGEAHRAQLKSDGVAR
jgi:hypothetical protein